MTAPTETDHEKTSSTDKSSSHLLTITACLNIFLEKEKGNGCWWKSFPGYEEHLRETFRDPEAGRVGCAGCPATVPYQSYSILIPIWGRSMSPVPLALKRCDQVRVEQDKPGRNYVLVCRRILGYYYCGRGRALRVRMLCDFRLNMQRGLYHLQLCRR